MIWRKACGIGELVLRGMANGRETGHVAVVAPIGYTGLELGVEVGLGGVGGEGGHRCYQGITLSSFQVVRFNVSSFQTGPATTQVSTIYRKPRNAFWPLGGEKLSEIFLF